MTTPTKYLRLLHNAGVPDGLPLLELDRQAAALLDVDKRTARRWRKGETQIPGPVVVALRTLAQRRKSNGV